MKKKFSLSKSNKIYFGVIAVLFLVLFFAYSDKTPEQLGELTGRLIFSLLFPSLFAWIVWEFSGKKEKGGNLTFNIVLTLIMLGQVGQLTNKLQQSQKIRELHEQKEEFKKEISNTDDPAEVDAAYNKFAESMKDGFNGLSETSRGGSEKQFFRIMSDFVTESQATAQNWIKSYNAALSPRILDYSLLDSDEEFDYQRNILKLYVEKTKVYDEFFANMVPNIKTRLIVLGEGNELAKGAVRGATEKYHSQKPIFEPLMQAHTEYGKNMIQILELLQKNKDQWAYENNELLVYSENVLSEYNELIEELGNNEATINTLSGELVEEM